MLSFIGYGLLVVQGKVDLLFYEGQQIGWGDLVGLRDKKGMIGLIIPFFKLSIAMLLRAHLEMISKELRYQRSWRTLRLTDLR